MYVSSPGNEELDQELDDCLVGPIPAGVNAFEFTGLAPDPAKVPAEDVLGVAALILTGSYKDQEFVRVGYYQNTEYDDQALRDAPPAQPDFARLTRDISAKPRVTRFQIKWCAVRARAPATVLTPTPGMSRRRKLCKRPSARRRPPRSRLRTGWRTRRTWRARMGWPSTRNAGRPSTQLHLQGPREALHVSYPIHLL
jgi:histone chaperone ASF1